MKNRQLVIWAIVMVMGIPNSQAHHSRSEYSGNPVREIEGEVVEVQWRSPHVMITVRAEEPDGSEILWQLEGSDAGTLKRRGLEAGRISVGDRVLAAGTLSKRRSNWLATTNVLLPDGTEMIFSRGEPRWADSYIGGGSTLDPGRTGTSESTEGFFHLWMRSVGTRYDMSEEPPLTAAARNAWQGYDQLKDDPVLDCVMPGMPRVMTVVGYRPIEFEQSGADILLHSENFNLTRTIHMGGDEAGAEIEATPLGYSVGRWEGDSLLVTTTRVSWPFFDLPPLIGIPQSQEVRIIERFTLDEESGTLSYDFWANDPVNFTGPIELQNYMVWGRQVGAEREVDNCVEYVEVP